MTDLPVYSPSETEDYLICPRFRVLKREWCPRGASWTPHMALGTAVHKGLETHYLGHGEDPLHAAHKSIEREFVEGSEWTLEGLKKLVEKGMKAALSTELLSPQGSVVGVELWAAHCKIDLVTREPFGLVVTDHKVSLELEKRRLEYKVREHDPSWQLLHEAWAVWQLYGEVPAWSRAHFVAIGPRPFTYIHSIQITQERLEDFANSGFRHWSAMQEDMDRLTAPAGAGIPAMNTRSCHRYGRKCEFYELCHVYGGDMSKAPTLYHPIAEAE